MSNEPKVLNTNDFFYTNTFPAEELLIKYGVDSTAPYVRGNENVDKLINHFCESLISIYKPR